MTAAARNTAERTAHAGPGHRRTTRAQNALDWATVGLSAAFCTTGVVLSLTGHEAVASHSSPPGPWVEASAPEVGAVAGLCLPDSHFRSGGRSLRWRGRRSGMHPGKPQALGWGKRAVGTGPMPFGGPAWCPEPASSSGAPIAWPAGRTPALNASTHRSSSAGRGKSTASASNSPSVPARCRSSGFRLPHTASRAARCNVRSRWAGGPQRHSGRRGPAVNRLALPRQWLTSGQDAPAVGEGATMARRRGRAPARPDAARALLKSERTCGPYARTNRGWRPAARSPAPPRRRPRASAPSTIRSRPRNA